MVREEIILFLMGGIFVAETVSVILQVASFKLRKKRIFKMAPLHHHFELSGWAEPKVIVRFWIITVILVLFGELGWVGCLLGCVDRRWSRIFVVQHLSRAIIYG